MSRHPEISFPPPRRRSLGLIGFGAFGQLMARHLRPHLDLTAYDPALPPGASAEHPDVRLGGLAAAAGCPIVVLAMPVSRIAETVAAIRPHLQPGALVLDVGSVKTLPAAIMAEGLPGDVDIVATHPLFGPQSARHGIAGLKIAVCPVRGRRGGEVTAFLSDVLGLTVIETTPEAHDRELAVAQGLTHLIAKVLVRMEPLPSAMTTRSFDLIMQAVDMVRHDAPEVFQAIEQSNPYAAALRRRFSDLVAELDAELGAPAGPSPGDATRGSPALTATGPSRHHWLNKAEAAADGTA
ncbi:prephenate dehydrogenase/arogenate dehydrogenase family protein [Phreatobacter stygius]|uniref:Prephenate dehydrogenase n=1 Tax=Phreatobacter stygius TaxID=1940610 RepID=A0A4D7B0V9_9HYPH|nr:prephenate dehydrogenase [Phreatobacter stygius]QCI63086.1 prephenate dehydrogenase [Phreatobacter stygius]